MKSENIRNPRITIPETATAFFIVDKKTSEKLSIPAPSLGARCRRDSWKSKGAATAAMRKAGVEETHHVLGNDEYIPGFVKRRNLSTGKEYWEEINTPNYLSPACESYWAG